MIRNLHLEEINLTGQAGESCFDMLYTPLYTSKRKVGYFPHSWILLQVKGKMHPDFVGKLILKNSKQMQQSHILQLQCLHNVSNRSL